MIVVFVIMNWHYKLLQDILLDLFVSKTFESFLFLPSLVNSDLARFS